MEIAENSAPPAIGRPLFVGNLLFDGEPSLKWFNRNHQRNRFFVANLTDLMQELRIAYSSSDSLLKRARDTIARETAWSKQFDFEFTCSKIQLQEDAQREAKWFCRAATIIVALELAASDRADPINVYERTAIIPAHYFVDNFDQALLLSLSQHFDQMPRDERIERFGTDAADADFETVCVASLGQVFSKGLLAQMAAGDSAPKFVCEKLVDFVNEGERFPRPLRVGITRTCGDTSASNLKLGTGNAAKALRFFSSFEFP